MAKNSPSAEVSDLRAFYESDANAKTVLDDFAGRTNNQRVTKVDQIHNRLRDADLPRWAIIALFRKLESLDYGTFVEGRKGHPSRFVWSANQIEVGKAAKGDVTSVASIGSDGVGENSIEELRSYQFPLRVGTDAVLELPADLTEREADRLAMFIKTLAVSSV